MTEVNAAFSIPEERDTGGLTPEAQLSCPGCPGYVDVSVQSPDSQDLCQRSLPRSYRKADLPHTEHQSGVCGYWALNKPMFLERSWIQVGSSLDV